MAAEQPDFVVAEESLFAVIDELPALFLRYGQEHANAPIEPDWQAMLHMAAAGGFRLVTARDKGVMVGFCANVITRPLMYRTTLYGTTIALWLDKSHRVGLNGYRLLKRNRELLEQWGCKRLHIASDQERLGMLFERLGYKYVETHYMRAV